MLFPNNFSLEFKYYTDIGKCLITCILILASVAKSEGQVRDVSGLPYSKVVLSDGTPIYGVLDDVTDSTVTIYGRAMKIRIQRVDTKDLVVSNKPFRSARWATDVLHKIDSIQRAADRLENEGTGQWIDSTATRAKSPPQAKQWHLDYNMISPTARAIGKGLLVFTNTLAFNNRISYGVNDRISIGLSLDYFRLSLPRSQGFNTFAKYSIPIGNRSHFAVGAFVHHYEKETQTKVGVTPHVAYTYGSSVSNISIGVALRAPTADFQELPVVYQLSGTVKLAKDLSFTADLSGDDNERLLAITLNGVLPGNILMRVGGTISKTQSSITDVTRGLVSIQVPVSKPY